MEIRDFVFWLQGFFEISESNALTPKQVAIIKEHLNLTFKHVIGEAVAHVVPVIGAPNGCLQHRGVQCTFTRPEDCNEHHKNSPKIPMSPQEIQEIIAKLEKHPQTTTVYC